MMTLFHLENSKEIRREMPGCCEDRDLRPPFLDS